MYNYELNSENSITSNTPQGAFTSFNKNVKTLACEYDKAMHLQVPAIRTNPPSRPLPCPSEPILVGRSGVPAAHSFLAGLRFSNRRGRGAAGPTGISPPELFGGGCGGEGP